MLFRTQLWLHIYRNLEGEGGGGTTEAATTTEATTKAADTTAATTTDTTAATTETKAPAGFDYAAWADGLTDAQKKDYAKRFKSNEDLLDATLNLRKDLSTRIKVPGKDATDEDKAAFAKAIGADPDPANYKPATPDGYELGEVQTALLGQMQKVAAATNVPTTTFAEFTKAYFEAEQAVQAKCQQEVADFQKASTAEIKKEYGANFETYLRTAETFVDQKLQVPEFTQLLQDDIQWKGATIKLRDHPAMIRMLSKIGLRTAEDGVIGHHTAEEKTSLRSKITEMEQKYPIGQRTKAQDAEIREMYGRLYD